MTVLSYIAHGGPLDGQAVQSRFPKGFLLVNKPHQQVWLYDYEHNVHDEVGTWVMRKGSPFPLDELLAAVAADSVTYDVRAYDGDD